MVIAGIYNYTVYSCCLWQLQLVWSFTQWSTVTLHYGPPRSQAHSSLPPCRAGAPFLFGGPTQNPQPPSSLVDSEARGAQSGQVVVDFSAQWDHYYFSWWSCPPFWNEGLRTITALHRGKTKWALSMGWWENSKCRRPYFHPLVFGHDRYPEGFSLDKTEPRSEPEFHEGRQACSPYPWGPKEDVETGSSDSRRLSHVLLNSFNSCLPGCPCFCLSRRNLSQSCWWARVWLEEKS